MSFIFSDTTAAAAPNVRKVAKRLHLTPARQVATFLLSPIDNKALQKEEERKDSLAVKEGKPIAKPFQFGYAVKANLNANNSGTWDETPAGRIWRLRVASPGAYSLNFVFDKFVLPRGALFFVYNEDQAKQTILGAYTEAHAPKKGAFGTWPVAGGAAVLEYFEPAYARDKGAISLDKIVHGYRDVTRQ